MEVAQLIALLKADGYIRFEHSIYRYAPKDPINPFNNERYIYASGEYQLA